jgi:predicted DNA-binding transcriptional regulator AlpA
MANACVNLDVPVGVSYLLIRLTTVSKEQVNRSVEGNWGCGGSSRATGASLMEMVEIQRDRLDESSEDRAILIAEAARISGLSAQTLKKLAKTEGGPKVFRLSSRRTAILRSDLRAWLASRAKQRAA